MKKDRDIPTIWELRVDGLYVGNAEFMTEAKAEAGARHRSSVITSKVVEVWVDRQGRDKLVSQWQNGKKL